MGDPPTPPLHLTPEFQLAPRTQPLTPYEQKHSSNSSSEEPGSVPGLFHLVWFLASFVFGVALVLIISSSARTRSGGVFIRIFDSQVSVSHGECR